MGNNFSEINTTFDIIHMLSSATGKLWLCFFVTNKEEVSAKKEEVRINVVQSKETRI